ncbi:MAG: hypothetical protein CBD18_04705 [Opitutales bacterium TMED158]|nr:MAG: hypothetical protein CBD18_04705 [Opitutales bacterium TMED158]
MLTGSRSGGRLDSKIRNAVSRDRNNQAPKQPTRTIGIVNILVATNENGKPRAGISRNAESTRSPRNPINILEDLRPEACP